MGPEPFPKSSMADRAPERYSLALPTDSSREKPFGGKVIRAVGVKDVLSKSLGSNNDMAMVNATLAALYQLRTLETISKLRGKSAQ